MASISAAEVFPYGRGGGPTTPAWGPPETAGSKGEDDASQQQASLLEVLPFDLNLKSSLFSQQLFRCCDFAFNSWSSLLRSRSSSRSSSSTSSRSNRSSSSSSRRRRSSSRSSRSSIRDVVLRGVLLQQRQRDGRGPAVIDEEREFQTVDSKPMMRHKAGGEGWLSRRRVPVKQTTAAFNEKTKEEEELKLGKKAKSDQKKQQQQQQARYARIHARHRAFSEWSIQPTNDWVVLAEVPLQQLHKQQIQMQRMHAILSLKQEKLISSNSSSSNAGDICVSRVKVEDIEWRGTLGVYSKQADKIASKLPVAMQNLSSNFYYYWVTTQDDEVISDYLLNGSKPVDVAATDQVLACLMAAPQSKYSWHLYITKLDNKLIIDKANGSIVDLLTVNETSTDPPMQDAENRLNRPAALGFEAVKINQNLRQQVLVPGEIAASYPPAPFVESGDTPATIAYRYRLFTVPPRTGPNASRRSINILTRVFEETGSLPCLEGLEAEVYAKSSVPRADLHEARDGDSFTVDGGGYIYICALNEFEPKGQKSWRTLLETQRGALLATEVRNNACKLRKFVSSAMIAGCDELRLGFVARKSPNDNGKVHAATVRYSSSSRGIQMEQHLILTVHNYQTRDLGRQIGLRPENAWGIVRSVVDLLDDKPDGRYVLLKDPTKPVMRLYSRPEDEEDREEVNDGNREENRQEEN
ncbi:hypothetical protein Emag_001202 [Eimeria magna]